MGAVLGGFPGTERQHQVAKMLATLPMRLGGLSLRSAQRMAHAAYWASWAADALPMISKRLPAVAISIVTALENQDAGELSEAAHRLDREGFVSRPDWRALSRGARTPVVSNSPASVNTMRLPVPNTCFWRPWCQLHVTKRICGPTLVLVRVTFSSELPRSLSSSCSVHSCSSGCASL